MNDGVRKLTGGHWNTRYVGPDGKRYSRTFRLKQDATYWLSHELRLIDLDQWSPPASRNPKPATSVLTVAEWDRAVHQSQGEPVPPADQTDDR